MMYWAEPVSFFVHFQYHPHIPHGCHGQGRKLVLHFGARLALQCYRNGCILKLDEKKSVFASEFLCNRMLTAVRPFRDSALGRYPWHWLSPWYCAALASLITTPNCSRFQTCPQHSTNSHHPTVYVASPSRKRRLLAGMR